MREILQNVKHVYHLSPSEMIFFPSSVSLTVFSAFHSYIPEMNSWISEKRLGKKGEFCKMYNSLRNFSAFLPKQK